jgi:hypothetical protein
MGTYTGGVDGCVQRFLTGAKDGMPAGRVLNALNLSSFSFK